jgi:hypothetical protein
LGISWEGLEADGMIDISEIEEKDWYHAVVFNPVFDFLKETVENIYLPTDGKAFSPNDV